MNQGAAQMAQQCFHCGAENPPEDCYSLLVKGTWVNLCCLGCKAAVSSITLMGLERYYDLRRAYVPTPKEVPADTNKSYLHYDDEVFQKEFVRSIDDHTREARLYVDNIVCGACGWLIKERLRALDGVIDLSVNATNKCLLVRWDNQHLHLSDIVYTLALLGFMPSPYLSDDVTEQKRMASKSALRRLAVAGIGTMQVMMMSLGLYMGAYSGIEYSFERLLTWASALIATVVVFYSAAGFFSQAYAGLAARRLTMDLPVALAIGLAYAASVLALVTHSGAHYFDSVTMFTFILLLGRYMQQRAQAKMLGTQAAISGILPKTVKIEGHPKSVVLSRVKVGDKLIVSSGEVIACDGDIVMGSSSIDESLLTGESFPLTKVVGDSVVAGSINITYPIVVEVKRVGEQTTLSSLRRLIEWAQAHRPAISLMADRLAGWFILAILIISTLVYSYWSHIDSEVAFEVALSVLIVSCPCALSLATPVSFVCAAHALANRGMILLHSDAIERLSRVTCLMLDKTGTLTVGKLKVSRFIAMQSSSEKSIKQRAASMAAFSDHPVALAIAQLTEERQPVSDVKQFPGLGLEAFIDGQIYLLGQVEWVASRFELDRPKQPDGMGTWTAIASEGGWLGLFECQDAPREDACSFIDSLRELSIVPLLVSGDSSHVVESLAKQLKIKTTYSGVKPAEKLELYKRISAESSVVGMVGDGINDAPVLAAADVSIAMQQGSMLAQTSADIVLINGQLLNISEGVRIARKSMSIIQMNIIWALTYNAFAIPFAAMGWVPPWLAAIGMSLSSFGVTLNAMRLLR